jgi:hypothetical protein
MNAPSGTLIAYATAPGSTASDGSGKNGLYTSAILDNIFTPNITIIQMFQNVRAIVSEKSNKLQIPWESTSLVGDFYFNVSSDFTTTNFSDISYVDKSYLIRSTSLINRAPNDIRIADIARKVKYLKTGINPVAYDTVLYAILNQGLKQRIKRKHYLNVFTNESIDTINNNTKGTKIGHIYISSSWENTAEGKLYFKKPFHYGTDFDLKSVHAEIKNTWVTIFTTFGLEDAGKTIGGGIIVYNRWIGGYVEGKKKNTLYYGLVKTIGYNFAIRVGHGSTLEYDRLNIGDIKMTEIGFR